MNITDAGGSCYEYIGSGGSSPETAVQRTRDHREPAGYFVGSDAVYGQRLDAGCHKELFGCNREDFPIRMGSGNKVKDLTNMDFSI